MKFNTIIPSKLQPFFTKEIEEYRIELNKNNFSNAWLHLEKAHIIGQRYPLSHTFVHWEMLKFGFRIKDGKEIIGQIPRLLIGGVKSFVGIIPIGNPGGANVPPLSAFPIDQDITDIFIQAEVK